MMNMEKKSENEAAFSRAELKKRSQRKDLLQGKLRKETNPNDEAA
jgi:hypothetical protein